MTKIRNMNVSGDCLQMKSEEGKMRNVMQMKSEELKRKNVVVCNPSMLSTRSNCGQGIFHCSFITFNLLVLLAGIALAVFTACKNEPDLPDTRPPVIGSAAADAAELQLPAQTSVTLSAAATSADGSAVKAYEWKAVDFPGTAPVIVSPSEATTLVTGLTVAGEYKFQLEVTGNNDVKEFSNVVAVVVKADGRVPDVTSVSVTSNSLQLPDETSVILSGVFNNENGLTVGSYEWKVVAPPALPGDADIVNTEDGILSAEVTGLNIAGTYKFQLTVIGSNGAVTVVEDVIEVVVNEEVDVREPTISSAAASKSTLQLAAAVADVESETSVDLIVDATSADGGDAKAYKWTFVSSTSGITPDITNESQATANVTGLTAAGTYTFEVKVTGNNDAIDTREVTVTVLSIPMPEIKAITIGGATANVDDEYKSSDVLTLGGNGNTIAEGCTYAWTYTTDPTGKSCTFDTTYSAATPNPKISGFAKGTEYTFTLKITNKYGGVSTKQKVVTIAENVAPNTPSATSTVYNSTLTSTGLAITLGGSATDPDGDTLTYQWTCTDYDNGTNTVTSPETVAAGINTSLTSGSTAAANLTLKKAGTYTFKLTASDGFGGVTDSAPITVTVAPYTVQKTVDVSFPTITNSVSALNFSPVFVPNIAGDGFEDGDIMYYVTNSQTEELVDSTTNFEIEAKDIPVGPLTFTQIFEYKDGTVVDSQTISATRNPAELFIGISVPVPSMTLELEKRVTEVPE